MKGKKYTTSGKGETCKNVMAAAKERRFGGRANIDGGNRSDHHSKEIGALPDGGPSKKHAGKASRSSVHGKPLMSAASGAGTQRGHKSSPKG